MHAFQMPIRNCESALLKNTVHADFYWYWRKFGDSESLLLVGPKYAVQERRSSASATPMSSPLLPDFAAFSNEEIFDWIYDNGESLGIEFGDGTTTRIENSYGVQSYDGRSYEYCRVSGCGDEDASRKYGHYDGIRNESVLYLDAFEQGFHSSSIISGSLNLDDPSSSGETRVLSRRLSRMEIAIDSLAHEALHSTGVEIDQSNANGMHPRSEARGRDAVARFRRKYGILD